MPDIQDETVVEFREDYCFSQTYDLVKSVVI